MPTQHDIPRQPVNTVVVHHGALGDWVVTFPILASLAAAGGVLAVTHSSKAKLAARLIPGVSAGDIERWAGLHADRVDAIDSALASAELVVSFVSNGRDAWAVSARRAWPGAKLAFVAPRPPEEWPEHVTRWHATQLAQQDVALPPLRDVKSALGADTKSNRVLVHPGSGGAAKCWPAERFESLVVLLRSRGVDVRVVLGEAELERWPVSATRRWCEEHGAAPLESLDALADTIAWCDTFVGNDSGPTHLAAFMGKRVVAMFGPSNPAVWSPQGPVVILLAPPTPRAMDWLDVKTVEQCVLSTC